MDQSYPAKQTPAFIKTSSFPYPSSSTYPALDKVVSFAYNLPMQFTQMLNELDKLNLPLGEYVIVSSGALAVRGIREARDLDIIVSDRLWKQLSKNCPVKKEHGIEKIDVKSDIIEILGEGSAFRDPAIASFDELIKTADIIENHPYINLELLKKFKAKMGREKDLKDIELINNFLNTY